MPFFFYHTQANVHSVVSHYAIKSNAAINILGHVFWALGQDFLLGHSILLSLSPHPYLLC